MLTFEELRELDSNERPQGYEPCELPTAPSRDVGGSWGIRTPGTVTRTSV